MVTVISNRTVTFVIEFKTTMKVRVLLLAIPFGFLLSCKNDPVPVAPEGVYLPPAPIITYSMVSAFPHDQNSFTEGLLVHNGQLFESTGSPQSLPNTKSLFGITDLKTGTIAVKGELDKAKYFGEGIVIFGEKIYQLTYQTQVGFIYDLKTFKKLGEFTYPSKEGWGMTTDSASLIMSDGTSTLTYLDPASQKVVKSLIVTENGNAVANLNELEYINGFIYANIWTTNAIVKIDPTDGKVVGKLDLYQLAQEAEKGNPNAAEMNGIAWDAAKDKIYVTGKMWPSIYEVKFEH